MIHTPRHTGNEEFNHNHFDYQLLQRDNMVAKYQNKVREILIKTKIDENCLGRYTINHEDSCQRHYLFILT